MTARSGAPRELSAEAKDRLRTALRLQEDSSAFPWQERLLRHFLAGDIPSKLDIPTGLGKTAVMSIWAVARSLSKVPLPRRLVYVVDRRAVVDQATREAEGLRNWIESDPATKAALGLEGPLPISTLRGQFADNKQWLEHPARPAIVVGTVDMVGSRLLFEGYGVSRKMRPMHAGFLGHDTLFVLDEAHLVPPFEQLLMDLTSRRQALGLPGTGVRLDLLPEARLLSRPLPGGPRTGTLSELLFDWKTTTWSTRSSDDASMQPSGFGWRASKTPSRYPQRWRNVRGRSRRSQTASISWGGA